MEICGADFKHQQDCDLLDYFHSHYHHVFPALPERSSFLRPAPNLWQVKTAIDQLLVERRGQAEAPVQVIDSLPLPLCTDTRCGA